MPPKVSLILTVHNREQYLEDAIASVQTQAYPDYELILWDDGSTDNSGAIANQNFNYRDQDFFVGAIAGLGLGVRSFCWSGVWR